MDLALSTNTQTLVSAESGNSSPTTHAKIAVATWVLHRDRQKRDPKHLRFRRFADGGPPRSPNGGCRGRPNESCFDGMSITSRNGKVANAIGPRKRADGVRLTREVVWALLPMSREDEAVAAIIDGALVSAELLEEDEHGLPSRRASNTRQAIKVLEPPPRTPLAVLDCSHRLSSCASAAPSVPGEWLRRPFTRALSLVRWQRRATVWCSGPEASPFGPRSSGAAPSRCPSD